MDKQIQSTLHQNDIKQTQFQQHNPFSCYDAKSGIIHIDKNQSDEQSDHQNQTNNQPPNHQQSNNQPPNIPFKNQQQSHISQQKNNNIQNHQSIPNQLTLHPVIINNQSNQQHPNNHSNINHQTQINQKSIHLKQTQINQDLKNKLNQNNITKKRKQIFHRQNLINQHKDVKFANSQINKTTKLDEQMDEIRMIHKMSFSRKHQNYKNLIEWDKTRASNLALHNNLIENLQIQVDKRLKSSIDNFEIYVTFFREKAKQQQKYCSHPIIDTRRALQNNHLSQTVYISCSIILNELSQDNNDKCRKVAEFALLVKQDILRDLMENHLNQSQKELLRVREKINTLKSSLKKYNGQTQQKTGQLAKYFNQNASNINFNSELDFYYSQLSFLRKADHQFTVQRKLGQYCLEYYHTAIQQQIKRSKVLKQAIAIYKNGYNKTYGNNKVQDIQNGFKIQIGEQIRLINQIYSLSNMFEQRYLNLLKDAIKMPLNQNISIEQFGKYVLNFKRDSFDSRLLFLKQFNIKTFLKNNIQTQEPASLVITVDSYIHFFINPQKMYEYAKPDLSLKIGDKSLIIKQIQEDIVHIFKKSQKKGRSMISYFFEDKQQIIGGIRFRNKDVREEFLNYYFKLKV